MNTPFISSKAINIKLSTVIKNKFVEFLVVCIFLVVISFFVPNQNTFLKGAFIGNFIVYLVMLMHAISLNLNAKSAWVIGYEQCLEDKAKTETARSNFNKMVDAVKDLDLPGQLAGCEALLDKADKK